jgi:hypothetical protein
VKQKIKRRKNITVNYEKQLEVVRLLREKRTAEYIIVHCKYTLHFDITREEIEEIYKKFDLKKITEEDEKFLISEICTDVKIAYLKYIEAKVLYGKMFAALNGDDKDLTPVIASKKICDVYDRMFEAMKNYNDLRKEAENEIKKNGDYGGIRLFRDMLRKIWEEKKGEIGVSGT